MEILLSLVCWLNLSVELQVSLDVTSSPGNSIVWGYLYSLDLLETSSKVPGIFAECSFKKLH